MAQNFDGENIDEFDEFLSIPQHFPHQNFPLLIFCRLPARPLFVQGVIASVYTRPCEISLSKYYINGKTVVYSYARLLHAFQTDQQSCAITYMASNQLYIYGCSIEMPVTVPSHQLFISLAPCITVILIDTCNRITPTRILRGFTLSSSSFMSCFMMFCLQSFIHSCDHGTFREYYCS